MQGFAFGRLAPPLVATVLAVAAGALILSLRNAIIAFVGGVDVCKDNPLDPGLEVVDGLRVMCPVLACCCCSIPRRQGSRGAAVHESKFKEIAGRLADHMPNWVGGDGVKQRAPCRYDDAQITDVKSD